MTFRLPFLALLFLIGIPDAFAQYNPEWVLRIPGWSDGITDFAEFFEQFGDKLVPLVNVIALLVITISAFGMVFSQSEKQSHTARQTLIVSLIGIALVWIAKTIRDAFRDQDPTVLPDELLGFAGWLRAIAVVLAVLMIIISGIRAIATFGSDDGTAHLRRTVIAVLVAVPLLILTGDSSSIFKVFTEGGSANSIIGVLITIVSAFLGLVGIAAVVVIVIAGAMMIVNIGNDDQYRRARDLILRVALGLVVIAASWALLSIIAGAMT